MSQQNYSKDEDALEEKGRTGCDVFSQHNKPRKDDFS
jgi:hypothetical protein